MAPYCLYRIYRIYRIYTVSDTISDTRRGGIEGEDYMFMVQYAIYYTLCICSMLYFICCKEYVSRPCAAFGDG